jgi:SPP1 gp7 family putative phage head morphogenesis protein
MLTYSFLIGIIHEKPKNIELEDISFEEAETMLASKIPITKKEWNNLEPRLRYRAFTVARLTELDAINSVKKEIQKAVQGKTTLKDFIAKASTASVMGKTGFLPSSPWYWDTVYRTNIHAAYNAGRMLQNQKNPPAYYKFSANIDKRTSSICQERNQIIKKADDSYWANNTPPLHYNCRSTLISLSEAAAKVLGIKATPLPLHRHPPQKGFGKNPLTSESYWKLSEGMKSRAKQYGVWDEFQTLAKELKLKGYGPQAPKVKRGYERVYESDSGGTVDTSAKHGKQERKANEKVAKILAERGNRVELLPVQNKKNTPNPDARINGIIWEIKTPKAITKRSIKSAISKGKNQAKNIVINLTETNLSIGDIADAIAGQIKHYTQQKPYPIKTIALLKNNSLLLLHQKELKNGTFFGKVQNFK